MTKARRRRALLQIDKVISILSPASGTLFLLNHRAVSQFWSDGA
ncbi:hypothetical protein HMPREF0880_03206 [Yokenella regensburgei ATCC 43003]|nr:hypothetical protein HMPREF0880_03206 [Yokenella regensburgei ATCC 43003]